MDASNSELSCEETNLSPLALLGLSRREMAAFWALSLYNWTVSPLKGQHEGMAHLSAPSMCLNWQEKVQYPPPTLFSQETPRAKAMTWAEQAGGRWPRQVSSQPRQMGSSGYMPQGRWQDLVKSGFAQIFKARSSHIWKLEIVHLTVF